MRIPPRIHTNESPEAFEQFRKNCLVHTRELLCSLLQDGTYPNDRYVTREFNDDLQDFLKKSLSQDTEQMIALIGPSGVGKSSAFCRAADDLCQQAEKLLAEWIPLLLLARSLPRVRPLKDIDDTDADLLLEYIVASVLPKSSKDEVAYVTESMRSASSRAPVIIMIDSVNEYRGGDIAAFVKCLAVIAARVDPISKLKICINCRDHAWKLIRRHTSIDPKEIQQLDMRVFTKQEAKEAFETYRQLRGRPSSYESLSSFTQDACRDPFMLRMIDDSYAKSDVPADAPAQEVYARYIESKSADIKGAEEFLRALVCVMNNDRTDQMTVKEAVAKSKQRENFRFTDELRLPPLPIQTSTEMTEIGRPEYRLVSSGILQEVHSLGGDCEEPQLKMHDRLFEYLLAHEILHYCPQPTEDQILKLVSWRLRFPSYWGVARYLLLASQQKHDLFVEMVRTENLDACALVIDVLGGLVALQGEKDSRVVLDNILKSGNDKLLECLARTAPRLGPLAAYALGRLLDGSVNTKVAAIAAHYLYLFWEQDPASANAVLDGVLRQAKEGANLAIEINAVRWTFNVVFQILVRHKEDERLLHGMSEILQSLCIERMRVGDSFRTSQGIRQKLQKKWLDVEGKILLPGIANSLGDLTRGVDVFPQGLSVFDRSEEYRKNIITAVLLINEPIGRILENALLIANMLAEKEPIANLVTVAMLAARSKKHWDEILSLVHRMFYGQIVPSIPHEPGFLQDRLFGFFTYCNPENDAKWQGELERFTDDYISTYKEQFIRGTGDPIGFCHTPLTPISKLQYRIKKGDIPYLELQLLRSSRDGDARLTKRIIDCIVLEGMHFPALAAQLIGKLDHSEYAQLDLLDHVLDALAALSVLAPDSVEDTLYRWHLSSGDSASDLKLAQAQRVMAGSKSEIIEGAALFWPFMDCAGYMLANQRAARRAMVIIFRGLSDYHIPMDFFMASAREVYVLLVNSRFSLGDFIKSDP